jgi:thioredoxin 1
MVELTKENFDAEVKESALPVLVDFWGPKCGPCMALLPNVHKMAEEYEGKVKFCSVDVSENRRVAIAKRSWVFPRSSSGRTERKSPGSAAEMLPWRRSGKMWRLF